MSQVNVRLTDHASKQKIMVAVEGRDVAPGLAITPFFYSGEPEPDRFTITHTQSGLNLGGPFCAHRAEDAAQIAILSRVDWTENPDDLKASAGPKVMALLGVMTHVCDPCFVAVTS